MGAASPSMILGSPEGGTKIETSSEGKRRGRRRRAAGRFAENLHRRKEKETEKKPSARRGGEKKSFLKRKISMRMRTGFDGEAKGANEKRGLCQRKGL